MRDWLTLGLELAGDRVDSIRLIALANRDEPEERERNRAGLRPTTSSGP